jgi:uncharacterized protein (DUF2141 family)
MKIIILFIMLSAHAGEPVCRDSSPSVFEKAFQDGSTLIVRIENLQTSEGCIRVGFYNGTEDFPYDPHRSLVFTKLHLHGGAVTDTIKDVTPGIPVIRMTGSGLFSC